MSQKIAVAVVFVMAMFISIMDITIVNVALPTIGRDFKVTPTAVDAIVISFQVSLAVFIPASGWLGDRFGGKRVLLSAIVIFTLASALCGIANTLGEMVVFRVLQGVGGGMLAPVGMAMMFRAYPPEERIRASAVLVVPTAFAPAIGPVLGGLLVEYASWRWIFFVNLPIGAAALIFGLIFLEHDPMHDAGRFDLPGFLLSGIGLGSLMYGVSEGPSHGWGSAEVVGTIVAGAVLLTGMVIYELRESAPIVAVRLLVDRNFRNTSLVMILVSVAFFGTLYLIALYYQDGRGMSALNSGLSTFPEAIGVMIGAQLASRFIYPRLGPRRHITLGLVAMTVVVALMSLMGAHDSLWWSRILMFFLGISVSQIFTPTQAASFATISPQDTGRASTMFNAVRQLGGAVGVAILTSAIVAMRPIRTVNGHQAVHLAAYQLAFLVAAGVALLGVIFAQLISDADAAATMPGRKRKSASAGEVLSESAAGQAGSEVGLDLV